MYDKKLQLPEKSDIGDIDLIMVSQGDGLSGLRRPGNLYC